MAWLSRYRLLLCLMLGWFFDASAAESPQQWLESMSKAMAMLSYEGELIYQHGKAIEVLQLVHTVRDGRERERLTSLNGIPREVIRDHESVLCVLPGSRSVSVDQRGGGYGFPNLFPLALNELTDVYRIRFSKDARVAGREARGVDIIPKDNYRHGHRLYLDKEYRLPLKQSVLDEKGRRVVLIMYTRLRVDSDIPFERSRPSIHSRDYALVKHQARPSRALQSPYGWSFLNLPRGFHVNHREVRKDDAGEALEHLVLSDGLASVSLYIEKAGSGNGLVGASRMGAVSAYGRRLDGRQITAVGEVPEATVRFIAEAVEFGQ